MHELDDKTLLRAYVDHGSEEAFATLVVRHVNKVYSVALRHTGNPHRAEEITQAVFVILARKSRHLGQKIIFRAWLYQTARFAALTFIRGEIRRAHREQEAHMQTVANENESQVWTQIAPLLDSALADLSETDRHAVVLRFFYGKSMKEVGDALGGSEGAARLRLHRALEKLRRFFVKRGIASTTAIIARAISANCVQAAPVALAKTATTMALANGAVTGSSTATLIQGTLKLMAWTKIKIAALAGIALLLASGTAIVAVKTMHPATPSPAVVEKIFGLYSQALALSDPPDEASTPAVIQVMTSHPPMALIRRSQARQPGQRPAFGTKRLSGLGTRQGHVELRAFLGEVIRYAYGLDPAFPQNRIIVPLELQSDHYDYVDTMPQGGKEVLQRALKDQFGVVARREMRGNLLLTMKNPAAGLRKHADDGSTPTDRTVNMTMPQLADKLSKLLGVEVTDQTGLAGGFDFTLHPRSPSVEDMKAAVLDELGLELVPAADRQPIEFIVVEKAR